MTDRTYDEELYKIYDENQLIPDGSMTIKQFYADRKAAGRAIDIATCEIIKAKTLTLDPYLIEPEHDDMIGTAYFVWSPNSCGWVHTSDLPAAKRRALFDRGDDDGALLTAAIKKHPGWKISGEYDLPQRIDANAPSEAELVEWFTRNFPEDVRAIEAEICENRARELERQRKSYKVPRYGPPDRGADEWYRRGRDLLTECLSNVMAAVRDADPDALIAGERLGVNARNDPAAVLLALHAHLRDTIDDTLSGNT
jgi:hypothetical protein